LRARYFKTLRGYPLEVLVESAAQQPGRVVGTSCRYAPVELPGDPVLVGKLIRVTAGETADGVIHAD
jgi:threonylcarbamoyladenosine tRNA methylthiotransferase MtaB